MDNISDPFVGITAHWSYPQLLSFDFNNGEPISWGETFKFGEAVVRYSFDIRTWLLQYSPSSAFNEFIKQMADYWTTECGFRVNLDNVHVILPW